MNVQENPRFVPTENSQHLSAQMIEVFRSLSMLNRTSNAEEILREAQREDLAETYRSLNKLNNIGTVFLLIGVAAWCSVPASAVEVLPRSVGIPMFVGGSISLMIASYFLTKVESQAKLIVGELESNIVGPIQETTL